MKKLRLELENLAVESFDTSAGDRPRGTVVGEQCTCPGAQTCAATCYLTCDDASCPGGQSCGGQSCLDTCGHVTCDYTCRNSCGGTCRLTQCQNTIHPCYIEP